jgi:hypothetical protein
MPPRWKRRIETTRDALPYANGPTPGRGMPMLSSGPDAPLSPRARAIFVFAVAAVTAAGCLLVAVSR